MPIFATGTAAAVVAVSEAIRGNGPPGYEYLKYTLDQVTANGLPAWANQLLNSYSIYYPTNAALARHVLDNLLGKDPINTPGLQSVLAGMFDADPANRGALVYQLADALTHLEGDAMFGAAALAWNLRVGEGYNIAMDTEQYVPKEGPGLPLLHGVQTLPLTAGADALAGSAYGETFLAHYGTLGPGDVLNGGGGDDWLMYRWSPNTSSPAAVTLEGFHTTGIATLLLNRRDGSPGAANALKVDVGGMAGLAHVISYASGGDVELLNVGGIVDLTLTQVFYGSTTVHYTPAALAASNGHMGVTLSYNGSFFPIDGRPIGTVQADGISTFDVVAGNSDVGELKSDALLHVNISGAGDLRLRTLALQGNQASAPNTLDAHTLTGRLDVLLATTGAGTAPTQVQGGGNVDTLRFTGRLADYALKLGASVDATTTLHDNRAGSARDYSVAGVERLVFADQSLALDMGANQEGGRVAMLLAAVLGPDALHDGVLVGKVLGLAGDYANPVSAFYSLAGLAGRVLNSDAYYANFSSFPDNTAFVKSAYTHVFGQAPDAATLAALQAPLDNHSANQGEWLAALVLAGVPQLQAVLSGYAQGGLAYTDAGYPIPF